MVSAADQPHVRFFVSAAGGLCEIVELVDLICRQFDAVGGEFSSARETCLVPGIGAMWLPCATHPRARFCRLVLV
jgi:hypothetical protein